MISGPLDDVILKSCSLEDDEKKTKRKGRFERTMRPQTMRTSRYSNPAHQIQNITWRGEMKHNLVIFANRVARGCPDTVWWGKPEDNCFVNRPIIDKAQMRWKNLSTDRARVDRFWIMQYSTHRRTHYRIKRV